MLKFRTGSSVGTATITVFPVVIQGTCHAAAMIAPTRSAAASTSRSPTCAYRSVKSAAYDRACGRRSEVERHGPQLARHRMAKSCRRTSSIPASRLAFARDRDCRTAALPGPSAKKNKALIVRGWRAMTACAPSLSQTVRGPVLASANLSMSPSTSDHRSFRISLLRQPVSSSRRMTSACARREGRSSTSRSGSGEAGRSPPPTGTGSSSGPGSGARPGWNRAVCSRQRRPPS